MKVDYIVRNADVFTSNRNNLKATSFAVKDGKFVYVGDEAGLADFEGEEKDLQGKFVTPALMDSHVHIAVGLESDYALAPILLECSSKAECLSLIDKYIKENPDEVQYDFALSIKNLQGETLCKEELDEVSHGAQIVIREAEGHSIWVNSAVLKAYGIPLDAKDFVPNLSYYVRDEKGEITGNLFEMTEVKILAKGNDEITDEQIEKSLERFIAFAKKQGVSSYFDAGSPRDPEFQERVFKVLKKMDEEGKLPIHIEGTRMICEPGEIEGAIDKLKEYHREYESEHIKFRTMKILSDGTLSIRTASMLEPYPGTDIVGGKVFETPRLTEFIKELEKEGFDLHVHTVGEGASHTVLDAVENAQKDLGRKLNIQVTCAHLEIISDGDLDRFGQLGVFANITPWWNAGLWGLDGKPAAVSYLGDKAYKLYRVNTLWKKGTNVCFSSDNIAYGTFQEWSPYLGMEIGINRKKTKETNLEESTKQIEPTFPPEEECLNMEQMLLGYTINNARQLRIDDIKGSIEVGKDADFLVFEKSLFEEKVSGLSRISPEEVYFMGGKQ